MVKDDDTVIRYACPHVADHPRRTEFNELVDMNSPGLKEWLGKDESAGVGWSKGDGSGKTVGHERYGKSLCSKFKPLFLLPFCSDRKIIKILEKSPSRDPEKYNQEDIGHMRRVVAHNKRHLVQEQASKQNADSKSAKLLKNWGSDA